MEVIIPVVYNVDLILPNSWLDDCNYRLREDELIDGIVVPAGFITDGATVPRWLRSIFPPVCQYFPAAVVHDYLLQEERGWWYANRKFKSALKECDIPAWRRRLMYWAVQGNGLYRTYLRNDPRNARMLA